MRKRKKRREKSYTIGRGAFAKISAIEGIRVTASMERDLREFERKGLTPAQQRAAIAKKYGKHR